MCVCVWGGGGGGGGGGGLLLHDRFILHKQDELSLSLRKLYHQPRGGTVKLKVCGLPREKPFLGLCNESGGFCLIHFNAIITISLRKYQRLPCEQVLGERGGQRKGGPTPIRFFFLSSLPLLRLPALSPFSREKDRSRSRRNIYRNRKKQGRLHAARKKKEALQR